jgi:rfaE bifunctional protein nucleotidyltransferase chain/domain
MKPDYYVFVNGTYDLLHPGHIKLLRLAKSLGGFLIAAIDSDERVKKLKGPERPIQDARTRVLALSKHVDSVFVFNSDEELVNLVKVYKPKYMVKGSDYKDHPNILGKEYCEQFIFVERDHHSTSTQIKHLRNR